MNLASRLDKGLFVDVLHEWQADPKFVEFLNNNKAVLCPLLMDDKVTMHLDDALAGKAFTACYDEHKDDFMDEFDFDLDAELDALDNDQLLIGS